MLTLPFVDEYFIHGPDKTKIIKDYLEEHKGEFDSDLIGDLSHINYRAENLNGIQIESVDFQSGAQYCMSYTYDWFVYNGCEDMDEQGIEDGAVYFTVEANGEIEFELPQPEERSTFNEF